MASLLSDLPGNKKPTRFTIEKFFENLPWAAFSSGLNALGGLAAGRLDALFVEWKPDWPAFPTFGLAVTTIALKAGFPDQVPADNVIREVASGIGGWVGDDMFYGLRDLIFRRQWKLGHTYKKGDYAKWNGKLWQAVADNTEEPGKGQAWKELHDLWRAQGFRVEDVKMYAQAFITDSDRVRAIAQDVAEALSDAGYVEDKDAFTQKAMDTLNEVINQFTV